MIKHWFLVHDTLYECRPVCVWAERGKREGDDFLVLLGLAKNVHLEIKREWSYDPWSETFDLRLHTHIHTQTHTLNLLGKKWERIPGSCESCKWIRALWAAGISSMYPVSSDASDLEFRNEEALSLSNKICHFQWVRLKIASHALACAKVTVP